MGTDKKRMPHDAGHDPKRLRNAKRSALPVFSVDTEDEAQMALVTFCVHRYDGSYRWSSWPRQLDQRDWQQTQAALDDVSDTLQEWWDARKAGLSITEWRARNAEAEP